jgi:hypothetical protein
MATRKAAATTSEKAKVRLDVNFIGKDIGIANAPKQLTETCPVCNKTCLHVAPEYNKSIGKTRARYAHGIRIEKDGPNAAPIVFNKNVCYGEWGTK